MGWLFIRLPSSFLPEEDQGILITSVQLPVGATQDRTLRVLEQVTDHYLDKEKDLVEGVLTVAGFGFGGAGPECRPRLRAAEALRRAQGKQATAQAVAMRAMGAFRKIKDGRSSRWRRPRSRASATRRLRFLPAGHRRRRP
jgi:multidrug efflux pump